MPTTYNTPTNIKIDNPNNIVVLPSLNILAQYPKCMVRTPRAELSILLPIALVISGLHSKTAKNNIIKDSMPNIPHIPPYTANCKSSIFFFFFPLFIPNLNKLNSL